MAGENDILHYVNSGAFKNFNQNLGTFEDSVEGAYNFNYSRYVSAKSDVDHAANHEAESDPHFTVNSNDSRDVAIDSVKYIIPQKTYDTFAVLSLNIQSIGAKFDSFLGFLSYLDENNIHFNAICLHETWLSHVAIQYPWLSANTQREIVQRAWRINDISRWRVFVYC